MSGDANLIGFQNPLSQLTSSKFFEVPVQMFAYPVYFQTDAITM
jgi:hypothetical protein